MNNGTVTEESTLALCSEVLWNKKSEANISALIANPQQANRQDPKNGNTPIHVAAQNIHSKLVLSLLKFGADVNLQNKVG